MGHDRPFHMCQSKLWNSNSWYADTVPKLFSCCHMSMPYILLTQATTHAGVMCLMLFTHDSESYVCTCHITPAFHCACLLVARLKLSAVISISIRPRQPLIRLTATPLCLFVSVYLCLPFSFTFAPGETKSYQLFPRRQVNALGFTAVSTV